MSTLDIAIVLAPLSALFAIMLVGFSIRHYLDNRP
jgi:hypothetical protein